MINITMIMQHVNNIDPQIIITNNVVLLVPNELVSNMETSVSTVINSENTRSVLVVGDTDMIGVNVGFVDGAAVYSGLLHRNCNCIDPSTACPECFQFIPNTVRIHHKYLPMHSYKYAMILQCQLHHNILLLHIF